MYEQYLTNLGNTIERIDRKTNRHSTRFVGQDMYPQFQTGNGWQSQSVDGRIYILVGDLWCSQETYKFISTAKSHVLTLSSMICIVGVSLQVPTFNNTTLILGQAILDLSNNVGYDIDINQILYPGEGYSVLADSDLTIEITYRELL